MRTRRRFSAARVIVVLFSLSGLPGAQARCNVFGKDFRYFRVRKREKDDFTPANGLVRTDYGQPTLLRPCPRSAAWIKPDNNFDLAVAPVKRLRLPLRSKPNNRARLSL
jgi:hypothetical protein